jgi:hypothetical protein
MVLALMTTINYQFALGWRLYRQVNWLLIRTSVASLP